MFSERPIVSKLIIIACVITFVTLGLYKLTYFGLEYDEALFINAALGDLDGVTFVYYKLYDIPILTYAYIGALKSWVYALIFKVFGVSLLSIRLPVLALATLNLGLAYQVVKQSTDKLFALLFLIVLCVDLTFLTLQRFDKGPSAIETTLKLLILLTAMHPKLIWERKALLILFLIFVGVFNKLNFIWFANAVFGVYFLQNAAVLFDLLKRKITLKDFIKSRLAVSSLVYGCFLLLFFATLKLISVTSGGFSAELIIHRLGEFLPNLKYTVMHRNIFHVFGWTYQQPLWNFAANAIFAGVIILNGWLYFFRKIAFKSVHTQALLLLFLLAIQYIITPDAQKIWHMFVLFPMVTFVILHTFWLVGKLADKKYIVAVPVFVIFFIGNVSATTLFYSKINQGACVTEIFIPEVKQVEQYLAAEKPTNVITSDWGIHTQMQAFFAEKHRFFEPFRMFRYPKLFAGWWEENRELLIKGKEFVILQPLANDIQQPPYYQYNVTFEEKWTTDFISFLEANNFNVQEERTIKNSCGDRLFIIYKARFFNSDNSKSIHDIQ